MIESDELARQAVQAGRYPSRKLRERAVRLGAVVEIAEHLIEGAVFFDDVDDVLDLLAQEAHRSLALRIGVVEVVLGDLRREAIQIGASRYGRGNERGALELELVLVRRFGGVA